MNLKEFHDQIGSYIAMYGGDTPAIGMVAVPQHIDPELFVGPCALEEEEAMNHLMHKTNFENDCFNIAMELLLELWRKENNL